MVTAKGRALDWEAEVKVETVTKATMGMETETVMARAVDTESLISIPSGQLSRVLDEPGLNWRGGSFFLILSQPSNL